MFMGVGSFLTSPESFLSDLPIGVDSHSVSLSESVR